MIKQHNEQHSDKPLHRRSESGNVFWYLFLCVGLLGALTYAISHSGRSSVTTLTNDKQNLMASDLIGYGDIISKAVTQLRLRGVSLNELSFANHILPTSSYGTYNSNPFNEIFNPEGGAIVYTPPASDILTTASQDYYFLSSMEVNQIGTTCGNNNCSDLILALPNIRTDICLKINELLTVPNPSDAPPTRSGFDLSGTHAPGTAFTYDSTIGSSNAALTGRSEACLRDSNGNRNIYYKVLWAR